MHINTHVLVAARSIFESIDLYALVGFILVAALQVRVVKELSTPDQSAGGSVFKSHLAAESVAVRLMRR
jgi:hypothetical protein